MGDVNVPTVIENSRRNPSSIPNARIVTYAWGQPLPEDMKWTFDIVLCGDLLYHVWSGRLHDAFFATLQDLYRRRSQTGLVFLFGGQVRSGRQEQQIFAEATR